MAWVTAYVDESLRLEGEGLYVLAAVLVPDGRAPAVRAVLRDQLRRGQRRLHWRDEGGRGRRDLASAVADLGVDAVVVTAAGVEPRTSERARRLCLMRLLWECGQRGVTELVIESRRHRDRYDREMFAQARRAGWVSVDVRYSFVAPTDEPLLWASDIVAGAVAAARSVGQTAYLDLLGGTVTVVTTP
jgi:hypothetical protein